jgi:hypothetical protein
VRPYLLPHRPCVLWRETVVDGGRRRAIVPLPTVSTKHRSLCAARHLRTLLRSSCSRVPLTPSPPPSAQRAIANLSAVDANYGRMVQQKVARIKVGLGHADRLSHQTAVLDQNSH